MKAAGLRRKRAAASAPTWALQPGDVSEETALLADSALRLFRLRKLIWKGNLALVGVLLVTHVSLKFTFPGFPAAEYLGTEIGILEAAAVIATRRMMKKEEQLRRDFFGRTDSDS